MIPKPGDVVELPDGRRLLVISPERAALICRDVQLWWYDEYQEYGKLWGRDHTPAYFRPAGIRWTASHFPDPSAVEIEPEKEEYEPECQ